MTWVTPHMNKSFLHVLLGLASCFVTASFAADALPEYQPQQKLSGTIRAFGTSLAGVMKGWEEGFAKHHPEIKFDDKYPSGDVWPSGMEAGAADFGVSAREVTFSEYQGFTETFSSSPVEVVVATGSYDIKGRSWAVGIYVSKDNPITQLTMKQLDGIFGSERTGAFAKLVWSPQLGRGADQNIRTWGQLGLTGEWANRPIQTAGYGGNTISDFFRSKVLKGSDKWNPNYREYVEIKGKMPADDPLGRSLGSVSAMADDLAKDKYAIGWTGVEQTKDTAGLKCLAIAADDAGPYVPLSRETVQARTYPLARNIYIVLPHPPGKALEPRVQEFLRYVLSREGQEVVARSKIYLPLPADIVQEQLKKIE